MFFSEQDIERLNKYRNTFETALNSGFARNIGSIALREIESIYDAAYGSHYKYNAGCSVCVLNFLKRVGKEFFKDEEEYRKQAEELALQQNNQSDLQTDESPSPKKNNRTRKITEIKKDENGE